MNLILMTCAAYLIGAIPTGVILTRLVAGQDIRNSGSGNIGATNVYRVAGRKMGVITLIGDCLKGVIPVQAATSFGFSPQIVALVALITFLGHCYPIYLGFKGGKGVATALGIFLVISPKAIMIALLIFIVVLLAKRYISLASITAAAVTPFLIAFFSRSVPLFTATLVIAAIVIWRHRANIERLRAGTENRFNI
jgi:glycerol-3-phosphate acyltransferase PlsY